ncbi:hypothetical protein CMUS01_00972 [Colletotrichum musicola]|uniref:Uncharacterized protein n=1 Tax=Colletotrichum musicola TaxID=2175873 RepID=A0A8H6U8Y2_9PEZI|nr:hypothetical protein CMUS01_00972 [Colletotrichum musicola]
MGGMGMDMGMGGMARRTIRVLWYKQLVDDDDEQQEEDCPSRPGSQDHAGRHPHTAPTPPVAGQGLVLGCSVASLPSGGQRSDMLGSW